MQREVAHYFDPKTNVNVRNMFVDHLRMIEKLYGVDAFKWFIDEKAPGQKISGRIYYNVDGRVEGAQKLKCDFKSVGAQISPELTEHLAGSVRRDPSAENLTRLYREIAVAFRKEISGIVDRFMETDYAKSHPRVRESLTDFLIAQTAFSLMEVALRSYAESHEDKATFAKIYALNQELKKIDNQVLISSDFKGRPYTEDEVIQIARLREEIQRIKTETNFFDLNATMLLLRGFTKEYAPNTAAAMEQERRVAAEKARAGAPAKLGKDMHLFGAAEKARPEVHWQAEPEEIRQPKTGKPSTAPGRLEGSAEELAKKDKAPKTNRLSRLSDLFKGSKQKGQTSQEAAKEIYSNPSAQPAPPSPAVTLATPAKTVSNPLNQSSGLSGTMPDDGVSNSSPPPRSPSPGGTK